MASDSTTKLRDILSVKVEQAKAGDYFALLDITESADEKQVKDAYFRSARLVHPDSLRKQSMQDRKDDAAFIFEKVTEAYHVLSDPNRRKAYLASRAAPAGEGGAPAAAAAAGDKAGTGEEAAKIALHQGKMYLNRRAFAQAEQCFRDYTRLKADSAIGHLLLGWCLFQNQTKDLNVRLEEAKASFQRAIKIDENNPDAHYYLSLYHKEKGDYDAVGKCLDKALELNKGHVPSLREKRLLEMRKGQGPKQQSIGDYIKGIMTRFSKPKTAEPPKEEEKKKGW